MRRLSKHIGNIVAYQRKRRAMTREELARALEMSAHTVGRLESGLREMTVSELMRLAEVFQCSVLEFVPPLDHRLSDRVRLLYKVVTDLDPDDVEFLLRAANVCRDGRHHDSK